MPKGHNMGKVDIPSNHSAAYPPLVRIAASILVAEGGAPGSGLHSWRCSDKERYPEDCTCVEDTVQDIIDAVLDHLREQVADLPTWKVAGDMGWVSIRRDEVLDILGGKS